MMTRQIAVKLGVEPLMAIDAKPHFEIHALQAVHCPNIPVALLALELPENNVWLVLELYEIRDPVNLSPRNGNILFIIGRLPNNFRMQRDNVAMTKEAFLHLGKARLLRYVDTGVAEPAIYELHARMYPMAERDGLFRAYLLPWKNKEECEHHQQQKTCGKRP
jgi:hypothetical protein